MDQTETTQRGTVVAIAKSWLRTPYRHHGRVKGAGVDCAMLLVEVFGEAGLIPADLEIDHYPPDWHLHRDEERYLSIVRRFAHDISTKPQPGDVVVWRFGRCFSHGAIVTEWPRVIHAYLGRDCVEEDAEAAAWLKTVFELRAERGQPRPRLTFSYW